MTALRDDLRRAVEQVLGEDGRTPRVTDAREVQGGCINRGMRITLDDGRSCFLKHHPNPPDGMFECEAEGLSALAQGGEVRVPRVLGISDENAAGAPQFIILEFIETAEPKLDFPERLGRSLAALHRREGAQFGFESDNYIGSAPQVNPWTDSWSAFFTESRLGVQLKLLDRRGYATDDLRSRVEKLMETMDERLGGRRVAPSLLHGDLWSGNVMTDETGGPVLVDPAVYYGDREADLAMTELFGRFDPKFYAAYKEAYPLEPGYEERRDLYNLYHLMNHLGLFGLGYMTGVMELLRRYT